MTRGDERYLVIPELSFDEGPLSNESNPGELIGCPYAGGGGRPCFMLHQQPKTKYRCARRFFLLTKYRFLCKIKTWKMSITAADKKFLMKLSCYFVTKMI